MRRLSGPCVALPLLLALLGCEPQTTLLSGEGILCTTKPDDNPRRICDDSVTDYVCIATYKKGETKAFVCRRTCAAGVQCPGGEICCAGEIHGRAYGNPGGCMLARDCQPPLGMRLPATLDGGGDDGGADGIGAVGTDAVGDPPEDALDADASLDAPTDTPGRD